MGLCHPRVQGNAELAVMREQQARTKVTRNQAVKVRAAACRPPFIWHSHAGACHVAVGRRRTKGRLQPLPPPLLFNPLVQAQAQEQRKKDLAEKAEQAEQERQRKAKAEAEAAAEAEARRAALHAERAAAAEEWLGQRVAAAAGGSQVRRGWGAVGCAVLRAVVHRC